MPARTKYLISRHAAPLPANFYGLCNSCKTSICLVYVTFTRQLRRDYYLLHLWQKTHTKCNAKSQLQQTMSEKELFLKSLFLHNRVPTIWPLICTLKKSAPQLITRNMSKVGCWVIFVTNSQLLWARFQQKVLIAVKSVMLFWAYCNIAKDGVWQSEFRK